MEYPRSLHVWKQSQQWLVIYPPKQKEAATLAKSSKLLIDISENL